MNNDLIYDWNLASPPAIPAVTRVLLNDETLRDGLQNPSVFDPPIEEKIEILHLMESLGIDSVNIGLPGAGARAVADTEALAREIATQRMKIKPNCAARTVEADILPIVEISQRVGIESDSQAGGGLDGRSSGTHHGKSGALRGGARTAVDVRDGRHDSHGPCYGEAIV
jgi:hypothetical protein